MAASSKLRTLARNHSRSVPSAQLEQILAGRQRSIEMVGEGINIVGCKRLTLQHGRTPLLEQDRNATDAIDSW